MAGVEAAGLTLGTFPLVIAGIQAYREGLKPLKLWLRYRTKVRAFHGAVVVQQTLFENNIQRLLMDLETMEGIPCTDISSLFLGQPGGLVWSNAELGKKIKNRLANSYDAYMKVVENMNATMEDLKRKIGCEGDKVYKNSNLS